MRQAIVTGTSSGIGRAVAEWLLRDGWSVVFAGRRADVLYAAIKESGAPAERTLAVPADVADPASVANLFAKTKQH